MSLRKPLTALVGLTLAAAVLVVAPVAPAAAQEEPLDADTLYFLWHSANQSQDMGKAIEIAETYLEQYPDGQYAEFLTKWLAPERMNKLNEAIKAGQVDEMLKLGNTILAADPENLNVVYALALELRRRELGARPRSYAHAAEAADLSQKAINLLEAGKTLAGVQNFDKNANLAWLYQNLAIIEGKSGASRKAVELYEKSTGLAPQDPSIAGVNLLAVLSWRQASYTEAANAYNALPDEERSAAEPSPEVTAARAKVDTEADSLIDVAARFVALAEVKGLPQATRDKVFGVLESVYKSRNPDDAEAAGLQAVIDAKK